MVRTKRNPSAAELGQLRSQLDSLQRQHLSNLSMPLYAPKLLISKCGIARKSLDNWHAREGFKSDEFVLDADAQRGSERNRLYSARDALLISTVLDFSANGVPLPVAKRVAKLAVDCILEMPIIASASQPKIIVFNRDSEWWVVPDGQTRAKVFSKDGEWREENIGDRLADAPPLRMVFDIPEFASRVFAKLGLALTFGNASDMRRAASELAKA
jgi:hypothetical protein